MKLKPNIYESLKKDNVLAAKMMLLKGVSFQTIYRWASEKSERLNEYSILQLIVSELDEYNNVEDLFE